MHNKSKDMIYRFLFALVLLLLVGCIKETIVLDDDFRPNPDGSIAFRLQMEDSEIDNSGGATKGTPQEGLAEYDSVCVNIYSHVSKYEETTGNDVRFFQKVRLEKGELTPSWKSTPPLFWPMTVPNDTLLSFFAYALDTAYVFDAAKAAPLAGLDTVVSFSPSTGVPDSIVYKVPSDVTRQPDLLVSTLLNQKKTDNISLTMKHALACVSFVGTAPEAGTFVKSITLRNVYGKGALALDEPSIAWTVYPDSKNFTVYEAGIKTDEELPKEPKDNEEPLDNDYLMTANGYLMMIPQKLTNAAIDVLYWNGKDDKANKMITYLLPTDDESYATWRPGKRYIYKFSTQSEDITVVYYEKYAENSYGLYYYDRGTLQNSILDKEILEAGYGVLSKEKVGSSSVLPIRLTDPTSTSVTSGKFVELEEGIGFLYPVSQTGTETTTTFTLPSTSVPQDVYFNGSSQPCGMIVPHFAKGVYTVETGVIVHDIRTPQQMRNITALSKSSARGTHAYTQELNLDFSKEGIGGGALTTAVVNCDFNDKFEGKSKRIENVTMDATLATNGALFQHNSGEIKEVILLNSSITSSGNTGGIAAVNNPGGVIRHARVIGELSGKPFTITGTSGYTGAIAGYNSGEIIGNTTIETATEIPVAEVSGWVSITGSTAGTGGITGENAGTIATCLVNGVHVTGSEQGDVTIAKINIAGGEYVGGIVGVNKATVTGNHSIKNGAEPDVAGLVSVLGTNFVGGIAGENSGTLNEVNVRLGRGSRTDATTITGKASVGGIVGRNTGTLKAENSFISVRGNIHISGISYVGGIVGNHEGGSISNCFVYNFYSQKTTEKLVHYAPKIEGVTYIGGIAGNASGTIKQCAVFSTVSAVNGVGDNGVGDDVDNAVAEIKATESSAGGIVGYGASGLTITESFVLGNVTVNGVTKNSGGIVGENNPGTFITSVHIGNSGQKLEDIYIKLFDVVKLPVRDDRMRTKKGVMTAASGTPTITGGIYIDGVSTGGIYIGGVSGVNWGKIENVTLDDNVNIGTAGNDFVGGITGGNGTNAEINGCMVYNRTGGEVKIVARWQVGGIVGVNNGIVDNCQLGLSGVGSSSLISIKGASKLGGIAGSNGGLDGLYPTGNENTRITNCNVYGKVIIDGTGGSSVGGIIGENLAPSRVLYCNVIGYASSGTNRGSYDVTIKSGGNVGGIAGANYGHIYGTSTSYSTVTHTAVITSYMYAGGLVGFQQSTAARPGRLYYCDVSRGVLVDYDAKFSGAFVGQLDGTGGTSVDPVLFGTTFGGVTNKIYTGTTTPVIINGNSAKVILPPLIGNILPFYPEEPMEPDATTGNLWTRFAPYNYLHYTTYSE